MATKILITGSAGFLGGRTAKYFASQNGEYSVIATSRRSERQQELEENNCLFIPGDLLKINHCDEITKGVEIVVHCAALSSPWGNYKDFYKANFEATQNLLDASVRNLVNKFILISTPSVYYNHKNRFSIKESDTLPLKSINHYASTKLLAEKLVLGQNGKGIQTLALRPRAIIGAEDMVIMPRLIRAYNSGNLKIIGNGKNICDLTCVRNVIAAIECSIYADEKAMGKPYNICNGEPVMLWDKINFVLKALDLKPVNSKIPVSLALLFASFVEKKHKFLGISGEPDVTKYGLETLAISMTLDISEAKQFLNYTPVQSTDEGLMEFIDWFKAAK